MERACVGGGGGANKGVFACSYGERWSCDRVAESASDNGGANIQFVD